MTRIIEVNLADSWDCDDEEYFAEHVNDALAEGRWLLRFDGSPGDFLVGKGSGVGEWATYLSLTYINNKFTLTAVEEVAR